MYLYKYIIYKGCQFFSKSKLFCECNIFIFSNFFEVFRENIHFAFPAPPELNRFVISIPMQPRYIKTLRFNKVVHWICNFNIAVDRSIKYICYIIARIIFFYCLNYFIIKCSEETSFQSSIFVSHP